MLYPKPKPLGFLTSMTSSSTRTSETCGLNNIRTPIPCTCRPIRIFDVDVFHGDVRTGGYSTALVAGYWVGHAAGYVVHFEVAQLDCRVLVQGGREWEGEHEKHRCTYKLKKNNFLPFRRTSYTA